MKYFILIVSLILPHLVQANELISIDVSTHLMICAKDNTCKIENFPAQTINTELIDNSIVTQSIVTADNGFTVRVNIDFSKNILKPYGLRFKYDYCFDNLDNSKNCQIGPALGFILTDDLSKFKESIMGFTGEWHEYNSLFYRPTFVIENILITDIK